MLAVRLGKEFDKWVTAAEESLAFVYQRFALASLAWNECHGMGPARPFLENRLRGLMEQAKEIYTGDAVDALRLAYQALHQSPWDRIQAVAPVDKPDGTTND